MKINLSMMGQPEEVVSDFAGFTNSDFSLQKFEFDFQSLNRRFRATGEIKKNLLMLEVKSGGETRKETRQLSGPVYPTMLIGTIVQSQKLSFQKKYSYKVFEPTSLSVVNAEVQVTGKEKILTGQTEYNLTKIEVMTLGLKTTLWVDENGMTRKETAAPGLVSIEEPREMALSVENSDEKFDILTFFSVPIDTIITEPRKLKYLKLQIENIDTTGLNLSDDFQKIIPTDPLTLVITAPESIAPVNFPIKMKSEFLNPSIYIQSDNSDIKRTADIIIGPENNAGAAGRKILSWVFNNVAKRATASLPSALDVLKNREGDCNEHAILFTALCRAAGIPTQICVGLVYVDGRFYYHAWNKVYFNEWISVDPTFNQFPSDATHIKFTEGELEEQAKVLKIVGAIKIRVSEFN